MDTAIWNEDGVFGKLAGMDLVQILESKGSIVRVLFEIFDIVEKA